MGMAQYKIDNTAESNIIGGLALFPNDTDYVFNELIGSDFEDIRLGEIYDAIREMSANNEKIDVALVRNKFKVPEYGVVLAECAEIFNTMAHYNDYIQTIKVKSQEKRLKKIVADTYINANSGYEILDIMRKTIEDEKQIIDGEKYNKHYVEQYMEYINQKQRIVNGEKIPVTRIGIPRLDKYLGGFKQSTVSCVGALPSTGKTDFMIQSMVRNCLDGKKVVAFTLEMSQQQYLDRLVAQITDIPYTDISKSNITDKELSKISLSLSEFYRNKPMIFDSTNTIEAIEKIICDIKPDFVCIDYLQIVQSQKRFAQRRFEIEEIGNVLKRVAKHTKSHIMVLSQLVRKRDGLPTMQDLKESGSIEQQSDYIMLMHRPYVIDKSSASPTETKLILDKNKFGECGILDLVFDGEKQMFFEMSDNFEG